MPASQMARRTRLMSASILTPSAARMSAEPDFDEKLRLPCLATGTPQPATTMAAAVEMLKLPEPSPPVPTVSMAPGGAVDGERLGAHGARGAGDLGDGLAAHAQRHEEPAHLRRRRVARHHRVERGGGLVLARAARRRRRLPSSALNCGDVGHAATLSAGGEARKLRSSAWPPSEAMLSGWNCTPWIGRSRWARPMISPSSVRR